MENSPSPTPEPQSLAELHAQNARELAVMFMGLAKLGAEMVEILSHRAREEAYAPAGAPTQLPALVAAHDVMLRSLRRTGLMIQKLTKPAPVESEAGRGGDAGRARSARRGGESLGQDRLEDLERLSDVELEALERLEGERALADRPLREIIVTVLKTVGVAGLQDMEDQLHLTPLEVAALVAQRAGLSMPGGAGGVTMGRRRMAGAGVGRRGAVIRVSGRGGGAMPEGALHPTGLGVVRCLRLVL